jgi:Domain of unknown function (DUF5925)/ATPase family associated with various cellular activities (AAA)
VARRLHLTFDLGQNVGTALFYQEALKRGLNRFHSDGWPTTAKLDVAEATWSQSEPQGTNALFEFPNGALGYVHVGFGTAFAQVAGQSEQTAIAGLDELRARLPRAERDREGRVPVTFWAYSPHGPMPMGRSLAVPTWEEIAGNYPDETGRALARLMSGDLSWRGGQLILWHGETGTGKTTALRALAREWADWCEPHYITDPEKFFGDQSDYMLSVMLQQETFFQEDSDEIDVAVAGIEHGGTWGAVPDIVMLQAEAPEEHRPQRTWRLLILEDTGELLSAEARIQRGQGLSRFLNVVDGLIGQGLRILVLVTTNEELGRLHPAVARPGRCAANVLFNRLPADGANAWLREHGHDGTVSRAATLADLYAIVEGWDVVAERQAMGFG